MEQPVIISAVRRAVGKFQGSLAGFGAIQLATRMVAEVVKRAGLDPAQVDEYILRRGFCVLS